MAKKSSYVSPLAGQKSTQYVGGQKMEGTYNEYGRWIPDAYAAQPGGPSFQWDRPDIATALTTGGLKAPAATAGQSWQDVMASAPETAQASPEALTNYLRGIYGLKSNQYVDAGGNIQTRSAGKTLAKIGLTATPILAAPFTGGATLMAIGAGTGAAAGALDGGWRGALTGGAMGAIPGAYGATNTAASLGAREALRHAILNPSTMARFGAFLPGRAGQMAGYAGMALNLPGLRGRFAPQSPRVPAVSPGSVSSPLTSPFTPVPPRWTQRPLF
jgi:hypothetical protein